MTDIDNEQDVRQRLHRLDAAEAALELFAFAPQTLRFLLAVLLERAIRCHLIERGEALDGASNRLEVGQHAAQPAMADIGHAATLGLDLDRFAG